MIRSISADGRGTVTELDASFTRRCESAAAPALNGTIHVAAPVDAVAIVSSSPSTVAGQPVTFEAVVAAGPSAPTGSVDFADGASALGTVPVDANGIATLTTTAPAAGSHAITATYTGDGAHAAGSGSTAQAVASGATSYWFPSTAGDYIGGAPPRATHRAPARSGSAAPRAVSTCGCPPVRRTGRSGSPHRSAAPTTGRARAGRRSSSTGRRSRSASRRRRRP